MRLPAVLLPLMISAPAASEAPNIPAQASAKAGATAAVVRAQPLPIDQCRSATAHVADGRAKWIGEPVRPRKLDELPAGTAYMAVYRTINGCEEPMTVVEYRNSSGR